MKDALAKTNDSHLDSLGRKHGIGARKSRKAAQLDNVYQLHQDLFCEDFPFSPGGSAVTRASSLAPDSSSARDSASDSSQAPDFSSASDSSLDLEYSSAPDFTQAPDFSQAQNFSQAPNFSQAMDCSSAQASGGEASHEPECVRGGPPHYEILGSYQEKHHRHHVFRALFSS